MAFSGAFGAAFSRPATVGYICQVLAGAAIAAGAAVQSLVRSITDATQKRLNDFAQTRNYDNTDSMAKYKDITDEEIALLPEPEQPLVRKFRAECRYFALAVAQTWAKLYNIMAEVESGTRPMPVAFSDVEPDLPVLAWPS